MPVVGIIFFELYNNGGMFLWSGWVQQLIVQVLHYSFILFADLYRFLFLFFIFIIYLYFNFFGDEFFRDNVFSQILNDMDIIL